MRYMLLIYNKQDDGAGVSSGEADAVKYGHWAIMEETRRRGILQGAEPLGSASTATTIRDREGKAVITDGPFAETKEHLGGYYILDCQDLDEAIAWAMRIRTACRDTEGVEIRPLPGLPQYNEPHTKSSL